jgi:hypothetical protein
MQGNAQPGSQPAPRREDSVRRRRRRSFQRPPSAPRFLRDLNARQNRVLIGAAVLLAILLLVPPWLHEYRTAAGDQWLIFAGFRPVFAPPATASLFQLHATRVDYAMLAVELLGLLALTTGGVRSMSDRR